MMNSKFIMKEETREDLENDFIFKVGFSLATNFKINEKGQEAVKGYLISKIPSVKSRLIKYYGYKWYDYIHAETALSAIIARFIKDAIRVGIAEIAAEYVVVPSPTSESPPSSEKANYVTGKDKKDSIQVNDGTFGVPI